ncbi:Protein RRP5 homolog [Babesia bigemina]|uniref:Protein RRP5 homolog n=1 Tax=Babesia bigemina TaxID=5866 RepID=A0A061DAC5_BABBI|nr:Protein RRP5 homolog [Babesia bigemina]CDR95829.1 Protein RRP5 homolog [Babesia bigemina]|eukprot:XP_012768015.1 Protein RRP5 homolog [Babesia bigemina]
MGSLGKSANRRVPGKSVKRKSDKKDKTAKQTVESEYEPVSWDLADDILSQVAADKEQPAAPAVEKPSKPKKKRARVEATKFDHSAELAKESKIRESEQRIAEEELAETPDSVLGFEKRVVAGGNSAALWMEYMAFHLKNGSLEGAREVVRRGLERIDFRALQERQTLWVAYLNMECLFGDRVKEVFQESLRFNHPKTMHLKLVNIFVKNRRFEDAVEICDSALKKFGKSKKVWNTYLRLLYEHVRDFEAARQVYEKCLVRIPSHKKVYMITSTALLEFKHASADRGQMLFENLLLDNPRRMDVWMQYICAYIKFQLEGSGKKRPEALRAVRNLFLRIITLDLKPKKMKVIFQKWLEFECTHGDDKSKALVQQKALEYVEHVEAKLKPQV